tara:strand:+ start:133 stop:348 length:216 start_codon:yes stop_codon:yes gene_type:complete
MLDDRLLPTQFDRKDIFTGKINTMVLNVSLDQMMAYHDGEVVQNAFPQLSVDEREFLISGVLPEDQDQYWS